MSFKDINLSTELSHYSFPSIEMLFDVILNVRHKAFYIGHDNNEPIYDETLTLPTLKFLGSTKLHGTNGGIIIDFKNEIVYFQARNDIRTPANDNGGFATYLSSIQVDIVNMCFNNLEYEIDWSKNVLGIYGEWCGGNLQRGVALNKLEKMFVIFGISVINIESRQRKWLSKEEVIKYKLPSQKVYSIFDFKTWEVDIDFSKHQEASDIIEKLTLEVEEQCPVSKEFNAEGVGEGIVWQCITEGYNNSGFWFKSKGSKHSKQKVRINRPIDNEKISKLIDIAEKITPSWRLEQIFNETFDIINGGKITRTKIGNYIKNVIADVIKEETRTVVESGFEYKEINIYVTNIARDYYFLMEKDYINL